MAQSEGRGLVGEGELDCNKTVCPRVVKKNIGFEEGIGGRRKQKEGRYNEERTNQKRK